MRRLLLTGISLMLCAGWSAQALAQQSNVAFGQVTRPLSRLENPNEIRFFLDELLIVPTEGVESVAYLEIIDITNNGFGPDDVVVAYPSQETFYLYPSSVSAAAQEIMSTWIPEAEHKYDAANLPAEFFNPESDSTLTSSREKARRAILYDLWRSLDRNYSAVPIKLLFERVDSSFSFQMWDFQEQRLSYVPPPSGIPDTTLAFDLLHVLRTDSLVIADTTIFDVLVLERTIEETVYLPGGSEPSAAVSSPVTGDGITRRDEVGAVEGP